MRTTVRRTDIDFLRAACVCVHAITNDSNVYAHAYAVWSFAAGRFNAAYLAAPRDVSALTPGAYALWSPRMWDAHVPGGVLPVRLLQRQGHNEDGPDWDIERLDHPGSVLRGEPDSLRLVHVVVP